MPSRTVCSIAYKLSRPGAAFERRSGLKVRRIFCAFPAPWKAFYMATRSCVVLAPGAKACGFIAVQFPRWAPVSDIILTDVGHNPRRIKQHCHWLTYKQSAFETP